MVVEKGYKLTEVGVIPEVWDCFSVRQLIDLLTDYDANGSFESVATNVNVYDFENFAWYVRSTDLENNSSLTQVKYVDEKSYKFLKKTSLFGGELLFLKRGDIGNVYLFEMRTEKATLAPNLYLLKLNNVSIPKYLYYFFTSDTGQRQLKSKNASSTLGALYKDDVKSIIVPLPPLPEQTAIANALSDMDALIAKTEKLIEKKKAIKQGVMQELLKPKEGWVTKKLGDLVDKVTTGKLDANAMKPDGEYRFYTCAKEYYFIDRYSFDDEALLISGNGANVGYIHYYKGKFNAYQRTYVLIGFQIDVSFLKIYLDKHLADRITTEVSAGNTPYIKMDTITEMVVQYPPESNEQSAISNQINDINIEIELINTKLQKLKHQKQGMMQALLTGKIRLI